MAQKIKSANSLLPRARNIRLIAFDVDGVLTAGDVITLKSGEEIKFWNSKDRFVLALLRDLKIPIRIAWLTGRSSQSVTDSAADLGVQDVVQGCKDKKAALKKILDQHGLSFDQAAFMGDDLIDLPPMKAAGLSACPSDAVSDILRSADYVSPLPGGRGCARDFLEFILRAQKKWDLLLDRFSS